MASEFAVLAQTGEKTALLCLEKHDWKLDRALENFFANPGAYYPEGQEPTQKVIFWDMYDVFANTEHQKLAEY